MTREKQEEIHEKQATSEEAQSGRGEDKPGGRDEVEGLGGADPEPPERDRGNREQSTDTVSYTHLTLPTKRIV